jgi:two-component system, OmpR family, sensor histidine kinase KdpD
MHRFQRLLGLGGEPAIAWPGIVATVGTVAIGTLLVYPLKSVAPVVSLGIVYLPAILLISIVWGLRLGLVASVASAIAFNFFHIPPLHRFAIASEQNWVALAAFVIAAVVSSAVAELAYARTVEAEALRRSDELKTVLLRSISHDLRTPLTSIIASGSALGSASLTARERTELSEAIVAEGKRLSRLVENLLDMSRLEAGRAEPRREPIDIPEVLDAAREGLADPDGVRLAVGSDLPMVDADAAQLERAFANLFENAVRYRNGGPGVSVESSLVGRHIVVRVIDRGPGISEDEQKLIFEPFQHGRTEARNAGSGLGLAIAKGFIEANGGEIAVESTLGTGTSFVVLLPHRERDGA